MERKERLKRWVAPGLCFLAGGRPPRPDTGARQTGSLTFTGGTMRELYSLAWPIATAMLGNTALGLVDTKLVGGLGAAALGGVGIATTLLFLFNSLVIGLMRGIKVRAAYAVGQDRPADATRYVQAGLIFGAAIGLLVTLTGRELVGVLSWLGIDSSTIPYARDYFGARATGAVATFALAALIQHRQGIGDSRTPMVVGLLGNVVNAVLSYGWIYGRFGLPALGVRGAGYGTVVAESLEVIALLTLLHRSSSGRATPSIGLRKAIHEVAALGIPTGLHFGLEVTAFTAFTALLGGMGASQIAAHQIALSTLRASFLPGAAVSEAASVLVAKALGQKRLYTADAITRSALVLGVGFMSLCGVLFGLFGQQVAAFFTSDVEVIGVARHLLLIAAIFQTLDAVNIIFRGALRGAKDVRWVAVVGTTVVWSSLPTAAFVLGRVLGWGAVGGWCGFVLETSLGAFFMWRRWSRGPWRHGFRQESASLGATPALSLATTN